MTMAYVRDVHDVPVTGHAGRGVLPLSPRVADRAAWLHHQRDTCAVDTQRPGLVRGPFHPTHGLVYISNDGEVLHDCRDS